MITEFIFCCALPGAGKSTYIASHYDESYTIVSADEIKKVLPGYDPENPQAVHETSVYIAKCSIFDLCNDKAEHKVILDGGGINNHYNVSIIEKVRETNPKAKITCLFFDTQSGELQVSQEQCPKIFQDYDIVPEFYINYSPEWL